MIKAIIFDMDGVLVDSEEFYMNRRIKFFDELNIEPGSRDINDFVGSNLKRNWEVLVPKDSDLREKLKRKYFEEFEPNNKIDFIKYARSNLIQVFKNLKNKNIKIVIASAGSKKNIKEFINTLNITSFIEFYMSGEECKNNKPNPEIYLKSIEKLGFKLKEIVVVEDSKTGIEAAKNAGLSVIAFESNKFKLDQSRADFKITDLKQIFNYI